MRWKKWIGRFWTGLGPSLRRSGRRLFLLGPLCLSLVPTGLNGGVVPGRWEKLDAQTPGLPVRMTLASGEQMTGLLHGSTPDAVRILEAGGGERLIPKSSVAKVETRYKVADPVDNGIAIGAGVGVAWAAAAGQGAGDFSRGGTIALMGLIGAGVGYLVDRARENPETLYRSR